MKTRDEAIRDLADHAKDQCEALFDKMEAVVDGLDNDGDPEDEKLCGIGRDRDGRSQMVFAAPGSSKGRQYVVYVDAILALAKLLNGEVQVQDEWRELHQQEQPRLSDGYTAIQYIRPGLYHVKGPGKRAEGER